MFHGTHLIEMLLFLIYDELLNFIFYELMMGFVHHVFDEMCVKLNTLSIAFFVLKLHYHMCGKLCVLFSYVQYAWLNMCILITVERRLFVAIVLQPSYNNNTEYQPNNNFSNDRYTLFRNLKYKNNTYHNKNNTKTL